MDSKIYFIIGVLLISLVSAEITGDDTIQDKLRDPTYQDDLRSNDTYREDNGRILLWKSYKTYNSSEKRIIIEDWAKNTLIDWTLDTGYKKLTSAGESILAEWTINDLDRGKNIEINGLSFYNPLTDYTERGKGWGLQYGENYTITTCEDVTDDDDNPIEECIDHPETNWTTFSEFSEIPLGINLVRLIANTTVFEEGEWVFEIESFVLIEWSGYFTSFGEPVEFDPVNGEFNSIVHLVNDTFYLNAFMGVGSDGFVVLLRANESNLTPENITIFEFDGDFADHIDMIRIEENDSDITDIAHVLIVYSNTANDADSVTLEINLTDFSITLLDDFAFNTPVAGNAQWFSVTRINESSFMVAYKLLQNDGFVSSLLVDPSSYVISQLGSTFEFATANGDYNSLVQINETHYLVAYQGNNEDGFLRVIKYDPSTFVKSNVGSTLEFDTTSNFFNDLVKVNETFYVNVWRKTNFNGRIRGFYVDAATGTITFAGNFFQFAPLNSQGYNSLVKINDTRFVLAHTDADLDGILRLFDLDESDMSFSEVVSGEFAPGRATWNSIVQIGNNTNGTYFFINTYAGPGVDGFASILSLVFDNSSCTNNQGLWIIDCSDNCTFNSNVPVAADVLITGAGLLTLNANWIMPSGSWQIFKENSCTIVINDGNEIG